MPLTQAQLDTINMVLNGDPDAVDSITLDTEVNSILSARDDLIALLRIHEDIDSIQNLGDIIQSAKQKVLSAIANLTDLANG